MKVVVFNKKIKVCGIWIYSYDIILNVFELVRYRFNLWIYYRCFFDLWFKCIEFFYLFNLLN